MWRDRNEGGDAVSVTRSACRPPPGLPHEGGRGRRRCGSGMGGERGVGWVFSRMARLVVADYDRAGDPAGAVRAAGVAIAWPSCRGMAGEMLAKLPHSAVAFWNSFAGLGLILGAVFFAASLTPSLIPRMWPLQGLLAGTVFAIGYGLGVFILWLWEYLELPVASERVRRLANLGAIAACAVTVLVFAWRAADWQNSIRTAMGMPEVETAHPFKVALMAAGVAVALILVGRLFALILRKVAERLERVVSRPLATVIGVGVAVTVFFLAIDGVIVRGFLHTTDRSFEALDALIEPDTAPPDDPMKTGSAASLVSWQDLGRMGRNFITSGPSAEDIAAFTGGEAMEPVRVYVGLNAADTDQARADLALRELIRAGGFEREVLVVAVPTGTGWMDPAAMTTVEYLHRGDIATVAQQYSYLSSWISLLAQPGYGTQAGRALFEAVYGHWRGLPRNARPRLYLYGLSLGALSSQNSLRLYEILADPVHGALWVGPPFPSTTWREATDDRNEGSPAWLPIFEDGSFIRFTNGKHGLDEATAPWGPMRVVYLQYASDPIVFFEETAWYRPPEWMDRPRGPDVSDELRWYPVVTFLQLVVDMMVGLLVPMGHGHLYAHADHIDPWIEVTAPQGWAPEDIARLRAMLEELDR